MDQRLRSCIFGLLFVLIHNSSLFSQTTFESSGLTLLEPVGVRASGLAEAFSAASDDITAFGYNPASLESLKAGQMSVLHVNGIEDENYSHLLFGKSQNGHGVGLSIGYYDGGDLEIFDGSEFRSVQAQQDIVIGVGYAYRLGTIGIGGTTKIIRSELAETASANAFAFDAGVSVPVSNQTRVGVAVQNIGSSIRYESASEELPQLIRGGVAHQFPSSYFSNTLFFDVPFYLNESAIEPGLGWESRYGVLALRAGYRIGEDEDEFTLGTGFLFGPSTIDYAFGWVEDLDSLHHIGMSLKFGPPESPVKLIKKRKTKKKKVIAAQKKRLRKRRHTLGQRRRTYIRKESVKRRRSKRRGVYVIRKGDTLESIALKTYGRRGMWVQLYRANQHLIDDPMIFQQDKKLCFPDFGPI